MKIHFLPTIWSDMSVIEHDGKFAVIDTGGGPWHEDMIRSFFDGAGTNRIEFILLTHFHPDHYGCLEMMVREFDVGTVYFKSYSGVTKNDGTGKDCDDAARAAELERCRELRAFCAGHSTVVDVEELSEIVFRDVAIKLYNSSNTVLEVFRDEAGGCAGQYICNENQNSLMAYFEYAGKTVLLCGDITDLPFEHPKINMMLTRFAKEIGRKIDVFKAPHHGYGVGSPEALGILSPSFVYITNSHETISQYTKSEEMLLAANPDTDIRYASDGGVSVEITRTSCGVNRISCGEK